MVPTIVLDETDRTLPRHLRCIIVGTDKKPKKTAPKEPALCYVLLVQKAVDQNPSIYEILGVARLERNQITSDALSSQISIQ